MPTTQAVPPTKAEELKRKVGLTGPRRGRWIFRLVLLLVVVGGAAGFVVWKKKQSEGKPPNYELAAVKTSTVRGTVSATGTVQGRRTLQIGAEVSGTVLRVLVDYNDPVKVGQILAEIDPAQLSAAVAQAQAQVATARANYERAQASEEEAKATAKRNETLASKGLISEQELELSRSQSKRAIADTKASHASIQSASAALAAAKVNLDRSVIRSPIDGVVLDRTVEVGQTMASSLQTPVLFTLARELSEMELAVPIDEADIGQVKEGQKAEFRVDAYRTRSFEAEIKLLRNIATTTDAVITYEALLKVDNLDGSLRPGMTAYADIITEDRENVLVVPNAALRFSPEDDKDRPGVFGKDQTDREKKHQALRAAEKLKEQKVRDGILRGTVWKLEGGKPVSVEVELGLTDGRVTEVRKGLSEGTEVIVDVLKDQEK